MLGGPAARPHRFAPTGRLRLRLDDRGWPPAAGASCDPVNSRKLQAESVRLPCAYRPDAGADRLGQRGVASGDAREQAAVAGPVETLNRTRRIDPERPWARFPAAVQRGGDREASHPETG